jgi:uncharacterized membrane protein
MGKQEIKHRETQVETNGGVGKQLEQTYTVDDNCLPSAQELAAYKTIDPKIVDYLINASEKEQEHRHEMDNEKLTMVKNAEKRAVRMNWWGMFFAFSVIVVMIIFAGYALSLNQPWFAGVISAGALVSVASIFIRRS